MAYQRKKTKGEKTKPKPHKKPMPKSQNQKPNQDQKPPTKPNNKNKNPKQEKPNKPTETTLFLYKCIFHRSIFNNASINAMRKFCLSNLKCFSKVDAANYFYHFTRFEMGYLFSELQRGRMIVTFFFLLYKKA